MPIKPTYLNDELYDYLLENFSCDDDDLRNLKAEAVVNGVPPIFITPEQGLFLQFLIRSVNAKHILELGTLAGYSALVMAKALPEDGKIITVEKNAAFAEFAQKKFSESEYSRKIDLRVEDASKFLDHFKPKEQLDFVFVDANKPYNKMYLDKITPLLKVGGIYITDNAFAFGHIMETIPERNPLEIKSMRSFNNYFRTHPLYQTCLVPIGDGAIMGVKIKEN